MAPNSITRRRLLLGGAALSSSALLAACTGVNGTGTTTGTAGGTSTGNALAPIVFQNSQSDPAPKKAIQTLVQRYKGKVTLNTVATEQFRAQLSTYLTSSTPPDVLSWYAGSVARSYASKDLLLDVSDLWRGNGVCANFSPALKELSTSDSGKQIFVPTDYYWWSIFYKPSAFEKWHVEPPKTWDDFLALCRELKGRGIVPLTNGLSTTPWMASGWFDYLDLRINGAKYHLELLAGKHAFTDDKVVAVMEEYAKLVPFFDPNMFSYSYQQAVTPMVQDKDAMYLVGAFVAEFFPKDQAADLDFFSVPPINKDVPSAEEAPTDGYFAAAHSKNPAAAKRFMSYMASPAAEKTYVLMTDQSTIPTNPAVDTKRFSPLVQKGLKLLKGTSEITQFFNRDSSDALQTTADNALTKFLANPSQIKPVLQSWQTAAEVVWSSNK